MPFPPSWPIFTPAGKLANWLEYYVETLELNVWTRSTLVPEETVFDEARKEWKVTIDRNGEKRVFNVSHIVLATGFGGGTPKMPPPLPGQDTFRNTIVHSSGHAGGASYRGKRALVVGACTSGHDISLDFYNHGADVTMLQRSPTFVMSVEKGIPLLNQIHTENGPPVEIADLMYESTPKLFTRVVHRDIVVPQIMQADAALLSGLEKRGFKTYRGPDGSGCLFLCLDKCGGYYFDTGACSKVISGDIRIKPGSIERFTETGVIFSDGTAKDFDVVVFATGYTGYDDQVRQTLGEEYAKSMSTIWDLDEEGELNGVFRDCGIPNCYYVVANLAWSRFNTRMTALQIVGERLGVMNDRYTLDRQRRGT
jgi:cation diffusion facilitator CzcD-associated flavoprotein CzcO